MHKQTLLLTSVIVVICLGLVMFAKGQWLDSVFTEQLKLSLTKTVLPLSKDALSIDKIKVKNSKITFQDVRLNDAEPVNQVESIEANKGSAFSLFLAGHVFSDLDIHKPQIHVSWKNIEISQLFMKAFRDFHPPMPFSHLAFHEGQLHISSPFGEFKISGNSIYSNDPGGKGTFLNSHFSADQPQLGFKASINTTYISPNEYVSEYMLDKSNIDLPFLKTRDLQGMLKSTHKDNGHVAVEGQFTAESLSISDIIITEAQTVLSGHLKKWKLESTAIIKIGEIKLPLRLEQNYDNKTHMINARIEAKSIQHLTVLLMSLKSTLSYKPLYGDILAPLMITEGNLSRLNENLDKDSPDIFILQISGPVHDLDGRITAWKTVDGVTSNSVIYLDPGTPPSAP